MKGVVNKGNISMSDNSKEMTAMEEAFRKFFEKTYEVRSVGWGVNEDKEVEEEGGDVKKKKEKCI